MIKTILSAIVESEERLREAMIASDILELDALLSKDLVFTNHLGNVISKSDDLEGHRLRYFIIEGLVLSDQLIKIVGEIAIVTVRAEIQGTYKNSPANGVFRFTRVWGIEQGSLKVLAGHSCLVI